ncbi:hypothetical protein [Sphingosinicella sp. LY1275]|uniref:hypothetical protein n=1 Tax=Sphingosinicella sp. LY1275 TaxID=3095379 RepID=UPI002ADECF59|nr:hypothetical protein [Sphingosinicella sp. LY1275]MEA1015391.1 hypothetical protein [Sphingosinicella sp. LY1275]
MDQERIIPNTNRALQLSKTRRKLFGRARQQAFLEHLAATCNVTTSAREAGVVPGTVYAHRMKNPDFRDGWRVALEQGYARLEAMLLERATSGAERFAVAGDKEVDAPFDWDKAIDLLRQHQRGLAGRTPDNRQRPARVPIEALTEKLVRKLKALGVVVDEE